MKISHVEAKSIVDSVVTSPPSYESLGYSEPVNSVVNKVGI
jgi:hypothetical protein